MFTHQTEKPQDIVFFLIIIVSVPTITSCGDYDENLA